MTGFLRGLNAHRRSGIAFVLLVAICAWWGLSESQAQPAAAAKGPDESVRLGSRVSQFLLDVGRDDADTALLSLLNRSPLLKDPARITRLKEALQRMPLRYGKFQGVELLKTERVGRSIVRCTCLSLCDDYPLVWNVTFYRPVEDREWTVISLQFHVQYDSLPAGTSKAE